MRILVLAACLVSCCFAQPKLTVSGSNVKLGQQEILSVSLSGSSGADIAGIQWSVSIPAGVTLTPSVGAASDSASKTVNCFALAGQLNCISWGLNAKTFSDGVLATLSFTPTQAGTLPFALSNTLAASVDAKPVVVAMAAPASVTITNPCDLNSDGKVDITDLTAFVMQVIGAVPATGGDLDGDGKFTIYDAQRLVTAAQGGACVTGPVQ